MSYLDDVSEAIAAMSAGSWESYGDHVRVFDDDLPFDPVCMVMQFYTALDGEEVEDLDKQEANARGIALLKNLGPELVEVARAAEALYLDWLDHAGGPCDPSCECSGAKVRVALDALRRKAEASA